MMMKIAGALALALTMAACADPYAAPPAGMSQRDAAIARYQCDRDFNMTPNPITGGLAYGQCMRAYGFGPAAPATPSAPTTRQSDGWGAAK